MKKPSFLERLTGSVNTEDEYDEVLDGEGPEEESGEVYEEDDQWEQDTYRTDDPQEGELPVDMYQTKDAIVIRALVAGVSPNDLDISITRDMVTIKGLREELQESQNDDYFHRELFWGSFSRSLILPEEVVIDEADAQEKHGLLEIRLPKLDKNRSTQLKVKTGVKA